MSFNEKIKSSRLFVYSVPGPLALWLCLRLEACLGLPFQRTSESVFTFSLLLFQMETLRVQKEPFNRKNARRQRVVTGVGNNRCHRGGAARAYVFVVRVVKLLAEGHLDRGGNRVYLAARSLVFSVTF